jgi:hypothetical protein
MCVSWRWDIANRNTIVVMMARHDTRYRDVDCIAGEIGRGRRQRINSAIAMVRMVSL